MRSDGLTQGEDEIGQRLLVVPGIPVGDAAVEDALSDVKIDARVVAGHWAVDRRMGEENAGRDEEDEQVLEPAKHWHAGLFWKCELAPCHL